MNRSRHAFLSLAAGLLVAAPALAAGQPAAALDPQVQSAVARARDRFLATQPFKRVNLSVWVQAAPGAPWRGGEVDASVQVYPASIVKLPYAIDAVTTCVESGRPPDCLHADVIPMLVDSDNVATGRVVDALTGTVNVEPPGGGAKDDPAFRAWEEARRHTEKRLASWGLLGGMRLLHKTFPTNSGEDPSGFEALSRVTSGRNSMSATDAARLVRALVDGEVDRLAQAPVLATLSPLLARGRFSLQSALSPGLPPGARLTSKIGSAYDTLEEVGLVEVPGQPRVVIAAFTNGLDQDTPTPLDGWRLGGLMALVLEELRVVPAPAWQRPSERRGTVARWVIPVATRSTMAHEVQYRFTAPASGTARPQRAVRVRCGDRSSAWVLPAALAAARPILVGECGSTPKVEVEVEMESPAADAGEVLLQALQ